MASDASSQWSGRDYSAGSGHHRRYDERFLQRHPPGPDDVVVDLGCGTGEFAARLAREVPGGRVIGVDADPSMLEVARTHDVANLELVQAPAERLDSVVAEASVDLVVSRAMLHWLSVSDYPKVFGVVWRVLRPGGWFHSESGGAGNVAAVTTMLDELADRFGLESPPAFPDAGVALELVEQAGFRVPDDGVRTVAQRRSFDRDELAGFLRTQASVALTRNASDDAREQIREACVAELERLVRHDGTYDQTFVRLEVLVQRPS